MSVNSTDNKVVFTGDGSTDIFPYTFKIYAESDLIVERVTIATGAVATGTLDTHYTVSGEGTETGGNVTTIGDWENTSALYKIVIRRKLPLTQEIEFVDNVGTPAATYKEGFDRLCMICQSLQEQIDRSLLRDPTQTTAITFPEASAEKLIGWNTAGTALENKETLDEDVLASAAALLVDAQTAATNSTNSANAAAISASEASAAQANLAAVIDTSIDLDGALASDLKVPSQLAVKTYADTKGLGDMLYADTRIASGTFTRDTSAASGDQAITGIGFIPKWIICFAVADAAGETSWGMSTGASVNNCLRDTYGVTAGTHSDATDLIHLITSAGTAYTANLKTFDADGFTITWTKTGSPTGTATVKYICGR